MLAGRGHQPAKHHRRKPQPGAAPAPAPDGIVGVAPEAQILSVSTWLGSANPAGKSDQDQIPEAVRWAVDNGAKVINISLGSTTPQWPQSWDAAFLYAEQKDVVIVAAAGNRVGGNVQVGAPATIPGVLTVAGLDREGAASVDSSSQGISIGVAAPAENLRRRAARRRLRRMGRHVRRHPHRGRRGRPDPVQVAGDERQNRSSTGSSPRPRMPALRARTRSTASAC